MIYLFDKLLNLSSNWLLFVLSSVDTLSPYQSGSGSVYVAVSLLNIDQDPRAAEESS